ncbi:methyltransferase [Klebsiella pneumoniae]
MYRMRDIARKGLAPPVLLLLCLLINIWARWPILMHIDEVFTISWRVCTALVTGGISLVLSLTGLVTLISNQTTLNALHPERTSMLVTRGCFRFSRNPVYLGFIGLHIPLALLLSSVIGLMITPFLILCLLACVNLFASSNGRASISALMPNAGPGSLALRFLPYILPTIPVDASPLL